VRLGSGQARQGDDVLRLSSRLSGDVLLSSKWH
jgi:hypothetical protein